MEWSRTPFFSLLILFVLNVLIGHPALAYDDNKQHVVLFSLDGFRHDYVELHNAAEIRNIAEQGVWAKGMTPVYPSSTFPNHISLVTGIHPTEHGIVDNHFYDKLRHDSYSMGKGHKDSSWIQGVPLWNLAEMQGLKAATYFWPESDARINGITPSYFYHYSKYADYQKRIDQIVLWLSLPEAQRPRFVAGYFSLTDTIGHQYGPTAPQTREAVQVVDSLMGQLFRRLQALPIDVNLVIVSDHGMTALDPKQSVVVSSLGIGDDFYVDVATSIVSIYAHDGVSEDAIKTEKSRLHTLAEGRFRVLTDFEREQRHYARDHRTGDIILEVSPPVKFSKTQEISQKLGGHGYYHLHPDMAATFIAVGPAFKAGKRLPTFSNLEVYPVLADILGLGLLSEVASDGERLSKALK